MSVITEFCEGLSEKENLTFVSRSFGPPTIVRRQFAFKREVDLLCFAVFL